MVSFLFWNLNRKPLQERVARLAATFGADFMLLAESPFANPEPIRTALNTLD